MWELICHQTYKWNGLPIDLSIYNSHGVPTDTIFVPDGTTLGSGALRFVPPAGRVRIPVSPAWKPLVGLRIEVTARLTEPNPKPHTLIAGHDAFAFFIDGTVLGASFRGAGGSESLDTYKNAVTYPGYRVPFGRWTQFVFMHDGLSRMCLYANGDLVAERKQVASGIQDVGPRGISIGNAVGANDERFGGDIDDIKVWRRDPHAMRDQFLDRPFDRASADCWARFLRDLREALAKHPDCAEKLKAGLRAVLDRFARAIEDTGPETSARYLQVREEYAKLWRKGRLDDPAMATLLADWCTWLNLVGLHPGDDPEFRALVTSECWRLVFGELKYGIDCDPQAVELLKHIAEACGRRVGGGAPSS